MTTVYMHKLSALEDEVLKRFSHLIEEELPDAVQIILFGSRARGDSNENSDLDVAVVLDIPYIDKAIWDKVWDIKWRVLEFLSAEDFQLSLIIVTLKDLISRNFGLENVLKTEGMTIWRREN